MDTLDRRSRLKPVPSPGVTQKLWSDAHEAFAKWIIRPETLCSLSLHSEHVLGQASSEGLGWKRRLHDTCCIRGLNQSEHLDA